MVTENKYLTSQAADALEGRWGIAVGTFLVYLLICLAVGWSGLILLLIGGALYLGLMRFSLAIARREDNVKLELLFNGFNQFGTALALYLLQSIFVFLWSLLLVIPGIIAAISYSQAFFILADNPASGAMEAINKSQKMMYGYKWKYFCLCCRFIGWALLCCLTLGIGFLWLVPYVHVSCANFYDDVRRSHVELV